MVANYTLQSLGQGGILLIQHKVDWNWRATLLFTLLNENLFLQVKEKTLEKVQKNEEQKKEVEQEKESTVKRKRNWKNKD